jgi:hypothetical protein
LGGDEDDDNLFEPYGFCFGCISSCFSVLDAGCFEALHWKLLRRVAIRLGSFE